MVKLRWQTLRESSQGFTLFEVLVACLISALFFLLVLQATSISSFMKNRASESTQVLSWVQKDFEYVRSTASNYLLTTLASDVSANAASAQVVAAEDLKDGDTVQFSGSQVDDTIYTINGNPTENWISLSPSITVAHTQGDKMAVLSRRITSLAYPAAVGATTVGVAPSSSVSQGSAVRIDSDPDIYIVSAANASALTLESPGLKTAKNTNDPVSVSRCNAGALNVGLADGLRDKLVGSDQTSSSTTITLDATKTITTEGKQFQVQRQMILVDISPYNLLQVSYRVDPPLGTPSPLDRFAGRILPEVAFYCP
jgi:Tfp pilus assembly protein PilE